MNLRESQIMKIHYLTGVCALFVVAVHIIMRLIVPFSTSLTYKNVIGNYHNIPYAVLLEIILILIAVNGFRIILLELRQNSKWEKCVSYGIIIASIAVIAYGTRTIIFANGLEL